MCVRFLVSEEETLDQWTFLKLKFRIHFLHVQDSIMLIQLVVDAKFRQHGKAIGSIGHVALHLMIQEK